ncbi:collagen alpha-1(I) chain-like [Lutra lutra]|uniref:collagen alpha-1(I) chain-like n=1 Tax=Lutra lutra TaxID=9657 RepID=UPI001FD2A720|nr:collagen alpha-1(I) chain-like [Lutra lutra]
MHRGSHRGNPTLFSRSRFQRRVTARCQGEQLPGPGGPSAREPGGNPALGARLASHERKGARGEGGRSSAAPRSPPKGSGEGVLSPARLWTRARQAAHGGTAEETPAARPLPSAPDPRAIPRTRPQPPPPGAPARAPYSPPAPARKRGPPGAGGAAGTGSAAPALTDGLPTATAIAAAAPTALGAPRRRRRLLLGLRPLPPPRLARGCALPTPAPARRGRLCSPPPPPRPLYGSNMATRPEGTICLPPQGCESARRAGAVGGRTTRGPAAGVRRLGPLDSPPAKAGGPRTALCGAADPPPAGTPAATPRPTTCRSPSEIPGAEVPAPGPATRFPPRTAGEAAERGRGSGARQVRGDITSRKAGPGLHRRSRFGRAAATGRGVGGGRRRRGWAPPRRQARPPLFSCRGRGHRAGGCQLSPRRAGGWGVAEQRPTAAGRRARKGRPAPLSAAGSSRVTRGGSAGLTAGHRPADAEARDPDCGWGRGDRAGLLRLRARVGPNSSPRRGRALAAEVGARGCLCGERSGGTWRVLGGKRCGHVLQMPAARRGAGGAAHGDEVTEDSHGAGRAEAVGRERRTVCRGGEAPRSAPRGRPQGKPGPGESGERRAPLGMPAPRSLT